PGAARRPQASTARAVLHHHVVPTFVPVSAVPMARALIGGKEVERIPRQDNDDLVPLGLRPVVAGRDAGGAESQPSGHLLVGQPHLLEGHHLPFSETEAFSPPDPDLHRRASPPRRSSLGPAPGPSQALNPSPNLSTNCGQPVDKVCTWC